MYLNIFYGILHLVEEKSKHRKEALELMETKDTLIEDIKQTQGKVQAEIFPNTSIIK